MVDKTDEKRFQIEVEEIGNQITKLNFVGDLDMYTLPEAKNFINNLISRKSVRLIIDLNDMKYIDSSGLGFFIGTLKKLRDNDGTLKLIRLNDYIKGIFKLIHLNYIIEIYDNLEEAQKAFG